MLDLLKGTITPRDWVATAGIVGLAAALAAAFFFFVHTKQQEQYAAIAAQNQQVEKDLAQARQLEANIEDLRNETQMIESLVSQFEKRLPSRRETISLLKEFERMATDEDIDVELARLPTNLDAKKETIPYSVVARGSFHQVASFINRLERFQRYLKVTNLDIGPSIKGVVEARFTLNTYRFLQAG